MPVSCSSRRSSRRSRRFGLSGAWSVYLTHSRTLARVSCRSSRRSSRRFGFSGTWAQSLSLSLSLSVSFSLFPWNPLQSYPVNKITKRAAWQRFPIPACHAACFASAFKGSASVCSFSEAPSGTLHGPAKLARVTTSAAQQRFVEARPLLPRRKSVQFSGPEQALNIERQFPSKPLLPCCSPAELWIAKLQPAWRSGKHLSANAFSKATKARDAQRNLPGKPAASRCSTSSCSSANGQQGGDQVQVCHVSI